MQAADNVSKIHIPAADNVSSQLLQLLDQLIFFNSPAASHALTDQPC